MFTTIIIFIIILGVIVLVHELGHFLAARHYGLKPKEFGIGFKPRAFGVYKSTSGKWKTVKGGAEVKDAADTIYSLNWLPLGGFVDLAEDEVRPNDPNHFSSRGPWPRSVILLAGVTMNFLLAIVLLSFGFMAGAPQAIVDLPASAKVENRQIQIAEVYEGSPAEQAGLAVGDSILSINNVLFGSSGDLSSYVAGRENQVLDYQIERAGEKMEFEIKTEVRPESGKNGAGISIVEIGTVSYPVYLAFWEGLKSTLYMIGAILSAFGGMIKSLLTGQGLGAEIAGPVGIAVLTGQVAQLGFNYIIQFAAILSINLGIINALPFPALDGGRVLFILLELIKGRPVKREVEGAIHYLGFALLMLLVLVVTFQDINRYTDFFKNLWTSLIG